MRRWTALLLACMLCLTGIRISVSFAEQHPITLSVSVDPTCELEQAGEISYLMFTLHNNSAETFTLYNAKLIGGYEDETFALDNTITILGGGTKEFTLYQVKISEEQFDLPITYSLEFDEHRVTTDEFGIPSEETITHSISAEVTVFRYIPPELTLSVTSPLELVRNGESFVVTYSILNDTKFDMSSLVLTDTSQGGTIIPLPMDTLIAGEQISVPVTYTMGEIDMLFTPCISYVVRQRPTETKLYTPLTVQSCVVSVDIQVQQYPTTAEGTTFALTVTNNGNRNVTAIQLLDEIHSKVGEPFDLAPDQQHVLMYTVSPATDSNVTRNVRFHGNGTDIFGNSFSFSDDQSFDVSPYISSDAVHISLTVILTDAYFNEQGDLMGKIRFTLSNHSEVFIADATLLELESLGTIARYGELLRGDTYYSDEFCLNGLDKLSFRLDVFDSQGKPYASDIIALDISNLESLASQTEDETVIYRSNAYLEELVGRFTDFLTVAGVVIGCIALFCIIVCLILYFYERKLRSTLPIHGAIAPQDRVLPLQDVEPFFHSPAEQFGYHAPAKLRNYAVPTLHRDVPELSQESKLHTSALHDDQTTVPVFAATTLKTEKVITNNIDGELASFDETRVITLPKKQKHDHMMADEPDESVPIPKSPTPVWMHSEEISSAPQSVSDEAELSIGADFAEVRTLQTDTVSTPDKPELQVMFRNDADGIVDLYGQEPHSNSPRRIELKNVPARRTAKDTMQIIHMP